MVVREAEALEIEHAQRVEDRLRAGGGLEMIGGQFRGERPGAEGVEGVPGGVLMGRGRPAGHLSLRDEDLRGAERGQDRQEVLDPAVGRHLEFAGREVEPGGVEAAAVERERGQVVVAPGLQLAGGEEGAGAQDPRQLPLDQFPGPGGLLLVAERHLFAGGEQLLDIVVDGVVGEAGHRLAVAVGQGEADQPGGDLRVLEEQLVEISQAKEEERSRRQPALHFEVLLHHRSEGCFGHAGGRSQEPAVGRFKSGVGGRDSILSGRRFRGWRCAIPNPVAKAGLPPKAGRPGGDR